MTPIGTQIIEVNAMRIATRSRRIGPKPQDGKNILPATFGRDVADDDTGAIEGREYDGGIPESIGGTAAHLTSQSRADPETVVFENWRTAAPASSHSLGGGPPFAGTVHAARHSRTKNAARFCAAACSNRKWSAQTTKGRNMS